MIEVLLVQRDVLDDQLLRVEHFHHYYRYVLTIEKIDIKYMDKIWCTFCFLNIGKQVFIYLHLNDILVKFIELYIQYPRVSSSPETYKEKRTIKYKGDDISLSFFVSHQHYIV